MAAFDLAGVAQLVERQLPKHRTRKSDSGTEVAISHLPERRSSVQQRNWTIGLADRPSGDCIMRRSSVPAYLRDTRDDERGYARWTDPLTSKRHTKRFPGEYASPESRAAYRAWLQQFRGQCQASEIREEHRRLEELSVDELLELWIADYGRTYMANVTRTRMALGTRRWPCVSCTRARWRKISPPAISQPYATR